MLEPLSGPFTSSAVSYTLTELARRMSYRDELGTLPIIYGQPNDRIPDRPSVIIRPCAPANWHGLLNRAEHSIEWLPADKVMPFNDDLPIQSPVPVLFWSTDISGGRQRPVDTLPNGSVVFHIDILASVFFMLSRWEETIVPASDLHGRFPATASVAYRQGFLERPIVDEYAMILQAWLKLLYPEWKPVPHKFSVKLSHDIDVLRSTPLRRLGGDLLKRRDLMRAMETMRSLISPDQDPALLACYELADLSERYGVQSAFFFMGAERTRLDSGYNPKSKVVQKLINDLRRRGHEIGFHPGYYTLDSPSRFAAEKTRIDQALSITEYGGRQHYLRFRAPLTWRYWEAAGLKYDSTLSYADHEGFRCGTCHPFHPFDVEQDRQMDLWELPLIVMEGTLKQYRNMTPEEGQERILCLAKRCQQVNGIFTLLWHNTSLLNEWGQWVDVYRQLLPRLAEMMNQSVAQREQ